MLDNVANLEDEADLSCAGGISGSEPRVGAREGLQKTVEWFGERSRSSREMLARR